MLALHVGLEDYLIPNPVTYPWRKLRGYQIRRKQQSKSRLETSLVKDEFKCK
jgi:hypothetical protein